tara:strand:- start:7303 stop:7662 length:360 start_codon:yes stop_codon:yes gene_type:complete
MSTERCLSMKITESRLRGVISRVISEINHMMPQMEMPVNSLGHDMSSFMDKALACCSMPTNKLFDMCARICAQNPSQASHCAELCACACRGDEQGCCRCLGEICKCDHCAQICSDCCGC